MANFLGRHSYGSGENGSVSDPILMEHPTNHPEPTMVDITVRDDKLIVLVCGLHVLWALRRRLVIPLSRVTEIRAEPDLSLRSVRGFRMPGTYVPGLITAGTYVSGGKSEFWDVSRPPHAVVIELDGGAYKRLVVDVADPAGTVRRVREAIGAHRN